MSATFIRKREDFRCENCGKEVSGDGYTNHCPFCLYSKHVDVYPGDRAAACGGMMVPIRVEMVRGEKLLVHRCEKCGHLKKNRCAANDDFDALLDVMRNTEPEK